MKFQLSIFITLLGALAALPGAVLADELSFTNGAVLQGTYLGGTETHLHFEADGTKGNYARTDVQELQVGEPAQLTGSDPRGGEDKLQFRNGSELTGTYKGGDPDHIRFDSDGKPGNYGTKDASILRLGPPRGTPPEPNALDTPTQWQEGDPKPEEAKVPATEPEQTSGEAPPSQPMVDEQGAAPGTNYVWVSGYWWWNTSQYVWVPGYWAVPPQPNHVYYPGYWHYPGTSWVYVRGGWVVTGTTTVVVYASPRPVVTVWVVRAPIRIVRRNRHWRRHHRHRRHHSYRHRSSSAHRRQSAQRSSAAKRNTSSNRSSANRSSANRSSATKSSGSRSSGSRSSGSRSSGSRGGGRGGGGRRR